MKLIQKRQSNKGKKQMMINLQIKYLKIFKID